MVDRTSKLIEILDKAIGTVSFEFLLTGRCNGGTIIVLRAILITVQIYILAIFVQEITSDKSVWWTFDLRRAVAVLGGEVAWFGAILAAVYAALYTRFSSQWTYLANVYNQICAIELQVHAAGTIKPRALIELNAWKAGFIEDAETLHLATKPNIASVIHAWADDKGVIDLFHQLTPGGTVRLDAIREKVKIVYSREASLYGAA